jgi:hypothetical protein|tara:strand:+ start:1259 stop:1519 length:261 start_codon:yes stop_codon:yes gene_type:complete
MVNGKETGACHDKLYSRIDEIFKVLSKIEARAAGVEERIKNLEHDVGEHGNQLREVDRAGWKVALAIWGAFIAVITAIFSYVKSLV